MSFDNRVAIVTGGAMGNGRGIVEVLAAQGVKVAIFDFSKELDNTVAELTAKGYEVAGFPVDIRNREQIDAGVKGTIAKWGKIDILVNNAGVMRCVPFLEADDANFDFHVGINLKGTWNVTQAVIPYMVKAQYGRIVCLSSVTGAHVTDGSDTAYAMTKAGIVGFGRSVAMEYITQGITCNIVCPGYIRTPMVENLARQYTPENIEIFLSKIAKALPIQHLGKPADIGNLVAYLVSDEAGFITARDIVIDGGCTMPETGTAVFEE